jgi:hypothetical protein
MNKITARIALAVAVLASPSLVFAGDKAEKAEKAEKKADKAEKKADKAEKKADKAEKKEAGGGGW